MAPSQPAREIKVNVPRLNSTAANRALATEVEKAAKEQNAAVDIRETVDPSSMLALAIVGILFIVSTIILLTAFEGKCFRVEFTADDCEG